MLPFEAPSVLRCVGVVGAAFTAIVVCGVGAATAGSQKVGATSSGQLGRSLAQVTDAWDDKMDDLALALDTAIRGHVALSARIAVEMPKRQAQLDLEATKVDAVIGIALSEAVTLEPTSPAQERIKTVLVAMLLRMKDGYRDLKAALRPRYSDKTMSRIYAAQIKVRNGTEEFAKIADELVPPGNETPEGIDLHVFSAGMKPLRPTMDRFALLDAKFVRQYVSSKVSADAAYATCKQALSAVGRLAPAMNAVFAPTTAGVRSVWAKMRDGYATMDAAYRDLCKSLETGKTALVVSGDKKRTKGSRLLAAALTALNKLIQESPA